MNHHDEPPIIGIDLGTSTCLACVMQGDSPLFIRPDLAFPQRDSYGLKYPGYLMPSVFCNRDGEELTGHRALECLTDPNYVGDVVLQVKSHMKHDEDVLFPSGGEKYSPSRISGVYLKKLLLAAERQLKLPEHSIEKAVVTVPTAFGMTERAATWRACEQAGLMKERVWLVDEPVAAAYSLGLHLKRESKLVLVVDLGGGTFDATLLRVGQGVSEEGYEELGREGNSSLGGRNWDIVLANWVVRNALNNDQEADRWLRGLDGYRGRQSHLFDICEKAKIKFFDQSRTNRNLTFNVDFRLDPDAGHSARKAPKVPVKAEWFLGRDRSLTRACELVCQQLLRDVGIDWKDLDYLYMAGGGSNMWTVRERFKQLWGSEPKVEDPQLAVAHGAALIAQAIREGRKPRLVGRPRYPNGIGIHTRSSKDGPFKYHPLVPRNRPLPIDPPLEIQFEPFPTSGTATRLCVPIVEQMLTVDGVVEVPLKMLTLEVPPVAMRGPDEKIVVSVSCTDPEECQLDIKVAFRRRDTNQSLTQEEIPEGRRAAASANGHPR